MNTSNTGVLACAVNRVSTAFHGSNKIESSKEPAGIKFKPSLRTDISKSCLGKSSSMRRMAPDIGRRVSNGMANYFLRPAKNRNPSTLDADPILLQNLDFEIMRSMPQSEKASELRAQLVKQIATDDKLFHVIQEEMRRQNCHTHASVGQALFSGRTLDWLEPLVLESSKERLQQQLGPIALAKTCKKERGEVLYDMSNESRRMAQEHIHTNPSSWMKHPRSPSSARRNSSFTNVLSIERDHGSLICPFPIPEGRTKRKGATKSFNSLGKASSGRIPQSTLASSAEGSLKGNRLLIEYERARASNLRCPMEEDFVDMNIQNKNSVTTISRGFGVISNSNSKNSKHEEKVWNSVVGTASDKETEAPGTTRFASFVLSITGKVFRFILESVGYRSQKTTVSRKQNIETSTTFASSSPLDMLCVTWTGALKTFHRICSFFAYARQPKTRESWETSTTVLTKSTFYYAV